MKYIFLRSFLLIFIFCASSIHVKAYNGPPVRTISEWEWIIPPEFLIAEKDYLEGRLVAAARLQIVHGVRNLLEQGVNVNTMQYVCENGHVRGKHILVLAVELGNSELVKAIVETDQKISASALEEAYELSKQSHKKIKKLISARMMGEVCNEIAPFAQSVIDGVKQAVCVTETLNRIV